MVHYSTGYIPTLAAYSTGLALICMIGRAISAPTMSSNRILFKSSGVWDRDEYSAADAHAFHKFLSYICVSMPKTTKIKN